MADGEFWLTEAQFARLSPLLPKDTRGVARVDDRRVISGIVHVLRSGCRWRDCPAYGPHTTVYNRFNRWRDAPAVYGLHKTLYNRFVRWARKGVWLEVFTALAKAGGPPEAILLDSTHVKAHRSAAGGKGGPTLRPSAAPAAGAPAKSTSRSISLDDHAD